MSNLERKVLPVLGLGFNITSGNTYVWAPLFQIAAGTGSGSRIGRKIHNVFLKMQFRICHLGQNPAQAVFAERSQVRILHLKSRVVDTASVASNLPQLNPTGMTQADIFRNVAGGGATYCEVDKNRWKVIKDVVYNQGISVGDLKTSRVVRNWFSPLGRKCTYRDDFPVANSHALEGQHYIVIVGNYCASNDDIPGVGDRVADIYPHGTLQWTDG